MLSHEQEEQIIETKTLSLISNSGQPSLRDVASVRSSEVYDVIDQLMPDGSSYTG
jgi:hypothetical protein